jgi:hypothetical protein
MEGEQERPAAGGGLLRSSGADKQAHQDAEIVAGDVDRYRLWAFSRPRNQVRRTPPRSRL